MPRAASRDTALARRPRRAPACPRVGAGAHGPPGPLEASGEQPGHDVGGRARRRARRPRRHSTGGDPAVDVSGRQRVVVERVEDPVALADVEVGLGRRAPRRARRSAAPGRSRRSPPACRDSCPRAAPRRWSRRSTSRQWLRARSRARCRRERGCGSANATRPSTGGTAIRRRRHEAASTISSSDGRPTFVKFTFFKIDPAWQRRDAEQRAQDKREFLAACEDFALDRSLRAYSTVGTRGDTDLLLLTQSPILEDIHTFHVVLAQSGLAQVGDDPPLLPGDDEALAVLRDRGAARDLHLGAQVPVRLPVLEEARVVPAARRGAPADHDRPHRDRPPLPADHDQHRLLVRARRPGVRRLLRGATSPATSSTSSRSCAARSRAPTRCATRRSSPAWRCRSARRSTRSTAPRRRASEPRDRLAFHARCTQAAPKPPSRRDRRLRARPASTPPRTCCSREELAVEVDMLDRLPTPFGLVRGGVAPDHPKIKSVIRVYEKTAAREGFRFFGNVELGRDVSAAELAERYHAVIYAYGAETDRQLGIPGEDLPGSASGDRVRRLVQRPPRLRRPRVRPRLRARRRDRQRQRRRRRRPDARPDRATSSTTTDTADHAIDPLAECAVREIVVLGRRGPAQAAFTNPEVRELGEMVDADIVIDPAEMELDELSRAFLESDDADITARKNVEIFTEFAERSPRASPSGSCSASCARRSRSRATGRVERIVVGRNELHRDDSGAIRARDTGERETIECGLVLRSIGYKGIGDRGRPVRRAPRRDPERGRPGDRSRGRRARSRASTRSAGSSAARAGVIGTNKKDAQETVDKLFEDLEAGRVPEPAAPRARRDRRPAGRAQARPRHLRGLGGDRPCRGRARQAPRPPAGQVLQHRRDGRGRFPRPGPGRGLSRFIESGSWRSSWTRSAS